MASTDQIDLVCHRCVSDEMLVAEIKQSGSKAKCTFCGRRGAKTWSIQTLADRIEPVFHENFVLSPSAPEGYELFLHMDKESTYEWTREGEPPNKVIQSMAGITEEIADAVIAELDSRRHWHHHDDPSEEDPFGYEACYVQTVADGHRLQQWWESIKEDVTHKSRFFSSAVLQFLTTIFDGLEHLEGHHGPAVITKGTDALLYRARVAKDHGEVTQFLLRRETELSAPPRKVAPAGRMNAAGISVFYGATEVATCIAEVRAPVGSSVVVAGFRPLRPLRLVNLKAFDRLFARGSMFHPGFQQEAERFAFMRRLSLQLSAPVLPSDEALDYVITQVICEYLATLQPRLDGLIYPSTQSGGEGSNVVLFSHACKVMPPDAQTTRDEVTVMQMSDEADDVEYVVHLTSVADAVPTTGNDDSPIDEALLEQGFAGWVPHGSASAELLETLPTLELVATELDVVEVRAVKFETRRYHVSHWQRDPSRDLDPNF